MRDRRKGKKLIEHIGFIKIVKSLFLGIPLLYKAYSHAGKMTTTPIKVGSIKSSKAKQEGRTHVRPCLRRYMKRLFTKHRYLSQINPDQVPLRSCDHSRPIA